MQQEVVRWNKDGKEAYVENMVKRCKSDIERLSMIANIEPQAAFSAFAKSVQGQWNYLQCVVPECDDQFSDIERAIAERGLPAVFGCDISSTEENPFLFQVEWGVWE